MNKKNHIEQTSFDHKMNPGAIFSKEAFIIGFNEYCIVFSIRVFKKCVHNTQIMYNAKLIENILVSLQRSNWYLALMWNTNCLYVGFAKIISK